MNISLRTRLVVSFLALTAVCGLVATLVGVRLIGTGIIAQAQDKVKHDLNSGRTVYLEETNDIKDVIRFTALRFFIKNAIADHDTETLQRQLEVIRQSEGLDILTLTDQAGRTLVRSRSPANGGDSQAQHELVAFVLSDRKPTAGTVLVGRDELLKEGPDLAERAHIRLIPTPKAKLRGDTEQTSALCIMAAAPILGRDSGLLGVLYGGNILNQDCELVDRVREIAYRGVKYQGEDIGTCTIFQGDLRISTNVKGADGQRAIGTQLSQDVYEQVLERGQPWIHRAFVVDNWYIAAYEPIKNTTGDIIGVLSVGVLEDKFTGVRDKAITVFLGITLGCIVAALIVSRLLANGILQPIKDLLSASGRWANGDLDYRIAVTRKDEIAQLEETFNFMASSLKERDNKLKEYTSQQMMKSERLATLGQLAAGVAHEINNPLGAISIYAQMVLDELGQDEDSCRESLAVILRQTNRAGRTVKDLLEFARQSEPEMRRLDINSVLGKAIAMTNHAAEMQNVSFVTDLQPDLPQLQGDVDKLEQVFINVIVNAIQAMPKGGTLTLKTRVAHGAQSINVEFSDTGCGIEPEHIKKVFDPFFSTKGTGEGTGLGLSVSLGIIQNHNGTIDVRSTVGKGSTFVISFPVEKGRA